MKVVAWSTTQKGLVIVPLATLLLAAGCFKKRSPVVTPAMVLEAVPVDYRISRSERPPKDTTDRSIPPGHSVPDDSVPTMTIATMTATGSPPVAFRILAQITSDKPFPPMRIQPGKNYLWYRLADSTVWITPANGAPSKQLVKVPGWVFPVVPGHEPSLYRVKVNSGAIVACVDTCDSGHCGMF